MKIKATYKRPPREGNGYSVKVPSELIQQLQFKELTLEAFIDQCNEAIKELRARQT